MISPMYKYMLIHMRVRKVLLSFLVFPVALVAAASLRAQPLAFVAVQPHPVDLTFPSEAAVEAVVQANVAAQVSGRVLEMRVDAGQSVRKGDLLLRIEAREASEAAAGASAQYINAKAHFERMSNLRKQNYISQSALDKAKADFESAQAAYGQAGVGLDHASIKAPISGVVAQRLIEQGEMASPGRPLLTLYDPAGLRVTASVPQYRLPAMRQVGAAKVEFPELKLWVDASSVSLLPTADAATHVSQVRVGLPDGLKNVIPGMFARVHFVLGRAERMTVPESAVVRRGEMSAVYVQDAQGALSLRQVRLGDGYAGSEIEVLAGLVSGEKVAVDSVKAGIELKSLASGKAKK